MSAFAKEKYLSFGTIINFNKAAKPMFNNSHSNQYSGVVQGNSTMPGRKYAVVSDVAKTKHLYHHTQSAHIIKCLYFAWVDMEKSNNRRLQSLHGNQPS